MNTQAASQSVLILGATGRTGSAIIRQLSSSSNDSSAFRPAIHAFCRNKNKLAAEDATKCTHIWEGDARKAQDLERVLVQSGADTVIVAVGNGDSVAKSDLRAANAQALASVLESNPSLDHVRVLVVSSQGAGASRIKVGMGIGKLIEYHLKYVLADHTEQEKAFFKTPNDPTSLHKRTTIVRPTALTEDEPTEKSLIEFGDHVKCPTIKTDRADLAAWITREISTWKHVGTTTNVTGMKAPANGRRGHRAAKQ